jgi:hypothetical protein
VTLGRVYNHITKAFLQNEAKMINHFNGTAVVLFHGWMLWVSRIIDWTLTIFFLDFGLWTCRAMSVLNDFESMRLYRNRAGGSPTLAWLLMNETVTS